MHRNKITAKECMKMCYGIALKFDWGTHNSQGLIRLAYMMDRMGGKLIGNCILQPKFEKKVTIDRSARDAGYRFIRENGPKSNNRLGSVSPDPWSILVFGPSCLMCSAADGAPVGAPTCSKPCKQILVSWASAFLSGSAAAALHSAMICWIADEQ